MSEVGGIKAKDWEELERELDRTIGAHLKRLQARRQRRSSEVRR